MRLAMKICRHFLFHQNLAHSTVVRTDHVHAVLQHLTFHALNVEDNLFNRLCIGDADASLVGQRIDATFEQKELVVAGALVDEADHVVAGSRDIEGQSAFNGR